MDGPRNAITYMWHLKIGYNELLCRTDTDSQTLKNLWFPKERGRGVGNALGVWDGNLIKLDCDDHCPTTNVMNSLSNRRSKQTILQRRFTYG